jgi:hypothetical protein
VHLVSQALEWMRAVTSGPRVPNEPIHAVRTPATHPRQPVRCPSAQEWARILQWARHRRAPYLWPPVPRALTAYNGVTSPVRAYVLPPEERQLALSAQLQP